MTDLETARADLAFMKELAEDRGPLPWILGAHMIAVGGTFGLNLIYTWAGLRGFVPWPEDWNVWAWAPATAIYVPLVFWLSRLGARQPQGPASRAFGAAWAAVGVLTAVIVATLTIASYRIGQNLFPVWPSLAMALYGGAWFVFAMMQRRAWAFSVAAGCCATALACAALVESPEHWLAMGAGSLLFLVLPGLVIVRKRHA